jgi:serine/threonine protein kinase/tetratricopeptide (TPR) repeat protein
VKEGTPSIAFAIQTKSMQKGTRISHYEILHKLGEGGMGVVYKARDTKLNRDVSLKFVPEHTTADEAGLERFLQEARSIARINHPNICQIYGIEEEVGGFQFIVMEFIDGANLHDAFISKLDSGSMTMNGHSTEHGDEKDNDNTSLTPLSDQVLSFALQIARGLDAAHKKGVIHRDIKPANIMISSTGEVKILDFGLAKVTGVDHLTKAGSTLGTVSYMSPEQVRGEELDIRSDLWSFGVVLYEMLSGKNPFHGDYEHSVMYSILNADLPPIVSKTGHIPAGLEGVLFRCLEKDPADRYQSVAELLKDLSDIAGLSLNKASKTGGLTVPDSIKKTSFSLLIHKRNILVASGLASIIVIITLLFSPDRNIVRDWVLSDGSEAIHVAVLPFTNIGGDSGRQVFADGLVETITSQLSRLEQFQSDLWVVPAGELRSLNISSAGEAYRLFKVNYAVAGSLQPIADRLRLTITLIDSRNLRQLNSAVIDVDAADILELHENSVESLLAMLNLELNPQTMDQISERKTSVPAAFELYIQGLGYLQRYERIENVNNAILVFEEAVKLDPDFALAFAALGQAYWRKYENTREREWIELASEMGQIAYGLNRHLLQAHVILGMIQTGTGNYDNAIGHYLNALSTDPTNADAYRGLAEAYEYSGNLDEAESTYKRAIQLKPDYWAGYNVMGAFYFRNNKFDEAKEQFQKVIELTPDNYRGYLNLGSMYYFTGNLDEAKTQFEQSLELEQTFSAASNLGTLYYSDGLYTEAASAYELALSMNESHYYLWGNLAIAYYHAPDMREKAYPAYEKAIEIALKENEINPNDADVIISLASYHARLGHERQSLEFIREALDLAPDNATILYLAGSVHENLGDRDEALSLIGKAIQGGYPESEIKRQPDLQQLIQDPRFSGILNNVVQ